MGPYVPKTHTSVNAKRGLFTVQDFIYDAENDRYTCPAGEFLTRGKVRSDRRDDMDHCRNLTACLTCGLRPRCTSDKVKRQKRWEHEAVLDRMQARLDRMPEAMIIRRQTVEQCFGTLKAWMGGTHFQTKTLERVKTEMSLQVLACVDGPLSADKADWLVQIRATGCGAEPAASSYCERPLSVELQRRAGVEFQAITK
jgi:hypothetical protein